MVLPSGVEPESRSNLELAGYKSAVLPLNYRSINVYPYIYLEQDVAISKPLKKVSIKHSSAVEREEKG
jgi:hypothetical protein